MCTKEVDARLKQIQNGQQVATWDLIESFTPRLWGIARASRKAIRIKPNRLFTGEIVSEVAYRLKNYDALKQAVRASHVFCIARRVANNSIYDLLRKAAKQVTHRNSWFEQRWVELGKGRDPEASIENGPATNAELHELREIIKSRPTRDRELYNLLCEKGMEQADAAKHFGVNVRTIKRWWTNFKEDIAQTYRDLFEKGGR